jgi:hypothetical protein
MTDPFHCYRPNCESDRHMDVSFLVQDVSGIQGGHSVSRSKIIAVLGVVVALFVLGRVTQAQDWQGSCYPGIHAPLYPCPRPNVPHEVGWTLITNPALAPHEMLYPHTYHALYPPYYYKNTCGLACIPFFPKPKLKGTEVTVKYKGSHGLFSHFYPSNSKTTYSRSNWR